MAFLPFLLHISKFSAKALARVAIGVDLIGKDAQSDFPASFRCWYDDNVICKILRLHIVYQHLTNSSSIGNARIKQQFIQGSFRLIPLWVKRNCVFYGINVLRYNRQLQITKMCWHARNGYVLAR